MSIAVSPGSSDPITYGHLDIIRSGSRVLDRLIVAVLHNASKKPRFTLEERMELIREVTKGMPNVEVDSFDGLLVDYIRSVKADVILRGLREIGRASGRERV